MGLFYYFYWVALIMLVCFFRSKIVNLEIKGIFSRLILASDLKALFEGACPPEDLNDVLIPLPT